MNDSLPRKFRRRDTSPEHPGKIFYQYKNGHEYWVTPERFEQNDIVRKRLSAQWQRDHSEKRNQDQRKWLAKPGKLEIKKQSYKNWVAKPEGRLVRRKVTQRYLKTVDGRLINCVRSRIWQALKKGFTKSASTIELVGCSMLDFRNHIERQFQDGMSWDNVGLWEIDHITPLSAFDMNDPVQQRLAFRYTNCRPLWKNLNRQKSDKIEGELFRGRDFKQNVIPFKAA
jgi:hypothetical protein